MKRAFWLGWRSWIRNLALGSERSAVSSSQPGPEISDLDRNSGDSSGLPTRLAGRQPDSRREAGATRLLAHRPFKILYATLYYDIRPTFVVDITDQFDRKFASLMALQIAVQAINRRAKIYSRLTTRFARALTPWRGSTACSGRRNLRRAFSLQKEVGLVDDLLAIPVKSI